MRDLKHIHYFEKLLEQADNELVRAEKQAGGVAVGYSCYYLPEALLNCGRAFSVRLRAPNTGSLDISQYYMSSFLLIILAALFALVVMIYWFNLDTKLVKALEKPMMKHYDKLRRDHRL